MAPKRCASVAELPRCREENCEGGPHETGPALGVRPRLGGSLCGRPENGRALGRNSTISRIGFTAASVLRSVPTCRCVPRSLFSRKRAAWCLLLTNSGIWCTTSSPYCSIQAREQDGLSVSRSSNTSGCSVPYSHTWATRSGTPPRVDHGNSAMVAILVETPPSPLRPCPLSGAADMHRGMASTISVAIDP